MKGSRAEQRERVRQLLNRVNLQHFIDEYPHVLSGGEQQRIALIRALAARPKIMLMDEPFSGLDNRLRDGIRDETLAILKDEGTAVFWSPMGEEAMRMADEIALMQWRIVQKVHPTTSIMHQLIAKQWPFFSDINVINTNVKVRSQKPNLAIFARVFQMGHLWKLSFGLSMCTSILTEAAMVPQQPCQGGLPLRLALKRAGFWGTKA